VVRSSSGNSARVEIKKVVREMELDSWYAIRKSSQPMNRLRPRLSKTPTATAARYHRRIGRLLVDLSAGVSIAFRPHDAQGFERAKPEQLTKIEISPYGSACVVSAARCRA
jgi:hypothetical protein